MNCRISLHCLETEHDYRGLSRFNLLYLLAHLLDRSEAIDPRLAGYSRTANRRGTEVASIESDPAFIEVVTRLLRGATHFHVAPEVPRSYEYVAAVRELLAPTPSDVLEIVRRWSRDNVALASRPVTFLGFDIVEWTSDWSVVFNARQWTKAPITLNQYQLLPDWKRAQRVWQDYLGADDADRGPREAYATVGLVSLGDASVSLDT